MTTRFRRPIVIAMAVHKGHTIIVREWQPSNLTERRRQRDTFRAVLQNVQMVEAEFNKPNVTINGQVIPVVGWKIV